MQVWTGLSISDTDISVYEPVCTMQLQADGGDALPSDMKVMALCYLIASKIQAKDSQNQFTSENLGGYSYSRKSTASLSYWLDMYNSVLNGYISKGGISTLTKGNNAERVDKCVLTLNRRFV